MDCDRTAILRDCPKITGIPCPRARRLATTGQRGQTRQIDRCRHAPSPPAPLPQAGEGRSLGGLRCLLPWLWVWPLLVGCQWLPDHPTTIALPDKTAQTPAVPKANPDSDAADQRAVLANPRWTLAPIHSDRNRALFEDPEHPSTARPETSPDEGPDEARAPAAQANSRPHWRHAGLEAMLVLPADEHPDFQAALADPDPTVSANAAIALVRLGDPAGVKVLLATIRSTRRPLPLRCAAIEALASLPDQGDAIRELLRPYASQTPPNAPPELQVELLRGLAHHLRTEDVELLTPAFSSLSPKVRAEAVWTWSAMGQNDLPDALTRLHTDRSPQVRIAVLRLAAARHHPEAFAWLSAAANDVDLAVRVEALSGLGEIGGPEVKGMLLKTRESGTDVMRAAAVGALARMNERQVMNEVLKDRCWRVRAVVADAIADWADRDGVSLATALLDDSSVEVQQRVLASIRGWPLELAGPVLLAGMGKSGYTTRGMAAQQLASRWAPAREFPTETGPQSRAESLARLQERFRQEVGFAKTDAAQRAIDQGQSLRTPSPEVLAQAETLLARLSAGNQDDQQKALAELAALNADLLPALEHLTFERQKPIPDIVYRDLLAKQSPLFARIEELGQGEVTQQRATAESLVEMAQRQPLPRLAVGRLNALMMHQADVLVWRSVLMAVAECPGPEAASLAYAGCSHPSPEVRKRACQHLGWHPDPHHEPVLLAALDDPHRSVVSAAVEALGSQASLSRPEALRRLLASPSESLRVDVAAALGRLGDPSGQAALERLAYSDDPDVRRQAALVLGELADPASLAILIHLLDDRASVRRAAMESLPKVAGHNVAQTGGQASSDTERQIQRWKQWWQQQAAATEPDPRR